MYELKDAVCLARSTGAQWQHIDLSGVILNTMYRVYSRVYLVLTHIATGPDQLYYVDMDEMKYEFSSYMDTVTAWLIHIGNRSLPTVSDLPNTNIKYARYSDAIYSGYKLKPVKLGYHYPDNYPEAELHDLEITRPRYPSTDLSLLHTHCLLSVNGLYHKTDYDGEKAYIMDGARMLGVSRGNHVGILSFLDIGKLDKHSILPENVRPRDEGTSLKDRISFTVPDYQDGKAFFLVLGGYLVFPDEDVFFQTGDKTFSLDIKQLHYVERIFESQDCLNCSYLEIPTLDTSDNALDIEALWSDEVIKRYVTGPNSFLVQVDISHISTNKNYIRKGALPGSFTAYQNPVYPLIVGFGKSVEYWKTPEDGYWAINVNDSYYRNYVFSYQSPADLDARSEYVNNNLLPNKPFKHSRAFFLEIAGFSE